MLARMLLLPVAAVLLLAGRVDARGQDVWGEVHLPGGVTAARRLVAVTSAAGHADAAWILDVTRGTYSLVSPDRVTDLLDEYVKYVATIAAATRRWPAGVVLPSATMSEADREGLKHYIELLGLRVHEVEARTVVESDDSDTAKRHAVWLAAIGVDLKEVAATLNLGHPARIVVPDSVLPLPLPTYWGRTLATDLPPVLAITEDRSNALLYYGLCALDDETLGFLATRPALVDFLRSDVGGSFSQFGRSIRVRQGAVEVPGGPSAARMWQDLVGASPMQAERFIRQLLERDDGRLALFYDVVSHVAAPQRGFVLGTSAQHPSPSSESVKRIYELVKNDHPDWHIGNRPFYRPPFDLSVAIAAVDVQADGLGGPAWWPSVLERVTDDADWPDHPDRILHELKDRTVNAGWLLDWISQDPRQETKRWQLFRFLQRTFPQAPRQSAPWIESALRALKDMPALALALERMDVRDPPTFGAIALAAHGLTTSGGADDAIPVLGRWQGALALVEQIQRRRHLPPAKLQGLLASLAESVPNRPDAARGFVATWITEHLLPLLVPTSTPADELEHDALLAFTTVPEATGTRVTWEGLDYVLDPSPAVVKSAIAIRDARRLPRLGELVALEHIRQRLNKPLTSLDELKSLVADLTALDGALAALPPVDGQPPDIVSDFRDARQTLQKITQVRDLRRATRQSEVLSRALDALTDAVVPSIVYALAVSPIDQPATVFAEAWSSHALGPPPGDISRHWQEIVWQLPLPEDKPGGGVMYRGGLLGLDLALSNTQLRHASAPKPGDPSLLDENDRTAITESLVLRDPAAFGDADATSRVVASLLAGREKVRAWIVSPPGTGIVRQSLLRTAIDEWRLNLILWQMARNPALALDELSEVEIYQLGADDGPPPPWGGPAVPVDGCWCSRSFRDDGAILRTHGFGLAASVQSGLSLRLAEQLAASKLPIALVPYLLPAATQDWIDHTVQAGPDDWQALMAWPKQLPLARLDDYLLQLVSSGTLSSPREPARDH